MTEAKRKEAIEYIEAQLESGYIDLGFHDQDELEIIKEAVGYWKFIEEWNSNLGEDFYTKRINVVYENGDVVASTDFSDEAKNLEVWRAIGLQEEDYWRDDDA